MVLLLAGYVMSFTDAKAWALRNWPDMNIYEDVELPLIIAQYHRKRGVRFTCITVSINDEAVVFFPRSSIEDPESTIYKYKQLIETDKARNFKAWLFQREWDKELAKKTKWTTVVDPYLDCTESDAEGENSASNLMQLPSGVRMESHSVQIKRISLT